MNIIKLQREVYVTACEKGWHDAPLREPPLRDGVMGPPAIVHTDRVLAKLALVHSELTEAREEWDAERKDVWYDKASARPNKPEGFIVEIADAVIRVLDTCEALGLVLERKTCKSNASAYVSLLNAHSCVSAMVEAARVGDYTGAFAAAASRFSGLFGGVCELYGLDLWSAVRLKVDYNKSRPHRHGGKLA